MEPDIICSCLWIHYLHAFLARYSHTSVSHLDHTDIIGTITYREEKSKLALLAITLLWKGQEKTNIKHQRVQRNAFLQPTLKNPEENRISKWKAQLN